MKAFGGTIQGLLERQQASNQGVSLASTESGEDGFALLEEVI
jgi:hypothetical protein